MGEKAMTDFREWAAARGLKVRVGTGDPLRPAHGYGPDEGEEYIRLGRGFLWQQSQDTVEACIFGVLHRNIKGLRNTEAIYADGESWIRFSLDQFTPEVARVLRANKRKTSNLTPEQREAIGARFARTRAARADLQRVSRGEGGTP
jgi:hypothetical protein